MEFAKNISGVDNAVKRVKLFIILLEEMILLLENRMTVKVKENCQKLFQLMQCRRYTEVGIISVPIYYQYAFRCKVIKNLPTLRSKYIR